MTQTQLLGSLLAVVFACFLALAWICGKVSTIERVLLAPASDPKVLQALSELRLDHEKSAARSKEVLRVAKQNSAHIDIATELGFQNAEVNRQVASDLAESIVRADNETTGEPGAAADAGLKSDPSIKKEKP